MSYPPARPQAAGRYTEQQLAYLLAQQRQQQQQPPQASRQAAPYPPQQSAAYYPSPESTSPSSTASSPQYTHPSPTLNKPTPTGPPTGQPPAQQTPTHHPHPPPQPRPSSKDPMYFCMYPEHQGTVTFVRKADLQRHYDQVHNAASVPLLSCPQPGCLRKGERGFGRKDKLVDHLREVHKVDIPKRVNSAGRV